MKTANIAIALGKNHWSQQHVAKAVVHSVAGKHIEYMALMNDPDLQPLRKRGFGNEAGRLFQGIYFLVELTSIPKDRKMTYGKIVCRVHSATNL
jgi:hypothetical protein